MGRRIAKTIEGQTTYFLYTDEGLIAELNQQGNLTKAYGWVANTSYSTSPLWQAEPKAGETTITNLKQAQFHTLTTDHLGTVQMATNEAGQVTWKAQSQAFGQTTLDEKNQITMNLRFPGQYFDEETGTHYNYFRDYNPSTGRYIQRDPIGLNGGVNVYAYVGENPAVYIDPEGLQYTKRKETGKNTGGPNPYKHVRDVGDGQVKVKDTKGQWGKPRRMTEAEAIHFKKKAEDKIAREEKAARDNARRIAKKKKGAIPKVTVPGAAGLGILGTILDMPSPAQACNNNPFSPMCQPGGELNWDDLDECDNEEIVEYNEDINDDYDGFVGRFQREAGPRQDNECIVRNYLGQIVTDPNGGFCPWRKN